MSEIKKLAVITGATGGIGTAIARRLAGSKTALFLHGCRHRPELLSLKEKYNAGSCIADLAKPDSPGVLFESFEKWADTFPPGKIESVSFIFAAGVDLMAPAAKTLSFEKRLARAASVDLFAPIALARRFAAWRQARGRGETANDSVLFFSWDGAFRGMEGDTAQIYAAVKGGLAAFAQSFAQDQEGKLRVLTISPGWIATAWGKQASARANSRVQRESLARRWGTPEEAADLAAFLISDKARYLNGVNIPLNGGFSFRTGEQTSGTGPDRRAGA